MRGKKECKKMGVAVRECLPSVWQRDEGLGESYGAYGLSDVSAEASPFVTKELRVRFLKAQLGAGVFRSALGTFHAPGFHLIVVLLCSGFTRFCFCFGRNFPRLFVPFSAISRGFSPLFPSFFREFSGDFPPFSRG